MLENKTPGNFDWDFASLLIIDRGDKKFFIKGGGYHDKKIKSIAKNLFRMMKNYSTELRLFNSETI